MFDANQILEGKRVGVQFYDRGPMLYGTITDSFIGFDGQHRHNLKLDKYMVIEGEVFEHVEVGHRELKEVI